MAGMTQRRGWAGRIAAAFCAAGLALGLSCRPAAAAELKKLVITQSSTSFLYGPIYVAVAKGFFAAEGLDVEQIDMNGGAKALSAVLGGSAQIYAGAPLELINADERGQKLKAFATITDRAMISLVMRKDVADRLHVTPSSPLKERVLALKGLNLGETSPKSSVEGFYRYLLRDSGIDPDTEANIVPVGSSGSAVAAFVAGKVDVNGFSSPGKEQAIKRGPGIVLFDMSTGDVPGYKEYPYISLIAREDWLNADPKVTSGVIRAVANALRYIQQDRDGARAILRKTFAQMDDATFAAGFEANMRSYPASPEIDPATFKVPLVEYGLINRRPVKVTPDQIATNAYVAAAMVR